MPSFNPASIRNFIWILAGLVLLVLPAGCTAPLQELRVNIARDGIASVEALLYSQSNQNSSVATGSNDPVGCGGRVRFYDSGGRRNLLVNFDDLTPTRLTSLQGCLQDDVGGMLWGIDRGFLFDTYYVDMHVMIENVQGSDQRDNGKIVFVTLPGSGIEASRFDARVNTSAGQSVGDGNTVLVAVHNTTANLAEASAALNQICHGLAWAACRSQERARCPQMRCNWATWPFSTAASFRVESTEFKFSMGEGLTFAGVLLSVLALLISFRHYRSSAPKPAEQGGEQ